MVEPLKKFSGKVSGRPSILSGSVSARGFVIRPEQILSLFHDTLPQLPIPKDAEFCGVGIEDAGGDSAIMFYYVSKLNPLEHCLKCKPEWFLKTMVELGDGLLPADSELDGIEVSQKFTVLLLRVKSAHWPPCPEKLMPLLHLRYDLGQLVLTDVGKAVEDTQRIRIQ